MAWMIDNRCLTVPNWNAPENIVAFTTQVAGGVSREPYDSLNLALHVGDIESDVKANRSLLPYSDQIHWLTQTHSDRAIPLPSGKSDGDAAYTAASNVACAVMTADCLPILLTNTEGQIVCAIHAGWKGLLNNIISKTINKAFTDTPPDKILAWIGPSIRQCHYEVDILLAQQFSQYTDAFAPVKDPSKAMLNLESIASQQLLQAGVIQISIHPECTYCKAQKYFSYRRASHLGFKDCGRMVSIIKRRNLSRNA